MRPHMKNNNRITQFRVPQNDCSRRRTEHEQDEKNEVIREKMGVLIWHCEVVVVAPTLDSIHNLQLFVLFFVLGSILLRNGQWTEW